MSATTSLMLRKASKRVLTLSEFARNSRFTINRSNCTTWGEKNVSFSTSASSLRDQGFLLPDSSSSHLGSVNFSTSTPKLPEPEPLAAVAYDYIDDDEVDRSDEDEAHDHRINSITTNRDTTKITAGVTGEVKHDVTYVISRTNSTYTGAAKKFDFENQSISNNTSFSPTSSSKFNPIFKSIHRATATATSSNNGGGIGGGDGNNTINAPYPPPSDEFGGKTFRKGSGGGGGGRYRCPKCGTDVTFKCDFEDNTFYCASCAGWFAGTPRMEATRASNLQQQQPPSREDGSIYEEYIAKDARNARKKGPGDAGSEQEIIMRHVSSKYSIPTQIIFVKKVITHTFFLSLSLSKSILDYLPTDS